jgi:hypothetical protein
MEPFDPANTRQYWEIVGDRIQNRYDVQTVLDIADASRRSGAHLCAFQFHGGDNQRWTFEYV